MKKIFGSISTGTMRTEDLIPAFMGALKALDSTVWVKLQKELWEIEAMEDGEDKDESLSYFLNESLSDELNNLAPSYFYFGSHPGDGSDYGFWLSEGAVEEFEGLKVSDTSEVPEDYSGEVMHVNDHGNVTLYLADNGKLSEVWSIV